MIRTRFELMIGVPSVVQHDMACVVGMSRACRSQSTEQAHLAAQVIGRLTCRSWTHGDCVSGLADLESAADLPAIQTKL